MIWAKVRKSDYKLIELNSALMGFDTNLYIEVETIHEFNEVDDFIFNPSTSSFYNIGVKLEVAKPEKTEVVQSAFASAGNFRFRGKGLTGTAVKSPDGGDFTSTIDWLVADERFINGTHVMLKNHIFGDHYSIDVIDKDFTYAGVLYPAQYDTGSGMLDWSAVAPTGVKLDGFIEDWNVVSDMQGQKPIKLEYPARLLAGLYIRLKYVTKSQGDDIEVKLNGFMHLKTESE